MVELSPTAHRIQLTTGIAAAVLLLSVLAISPNLSQHQLSAVERIKERGELRVITLNSATTYYQDAFGFSGFEYDLANWFAEFLGVEASFITFNEVAKLYPELHFNSGDIVAAGLTNDESSFSETVDYGPPYFQISNQLVYRKGINKRPRELEEIADRSLAILKATAHARILRELQDEIPDLDWFEIDEVAPDKMIERVDRGDIDFILADSHEVALQRRYFPELRVAFEVGEPRYMRWAFNREDDNSLKNAVDAFFEQIKTDGRLDQLIHRHHSHVAGFSYSDIQTFTHRIETILPRFEQLFRQAGEDVGIDWRLLAAIGYQESLWIPTAKSPTGVRGLMMLTQTTAKQMKVNNRLDPAESIYGGARYFRLMNRKIPERIPEPDRTWMALAAYNVGFGHLNDARIITQHLKGDPDKWIDVKQHLPKLAQKKWYQSLKHGYARGWEPVKYVENIRKYYDYLVGLDADNGDLPNPTELELPTSPSI